MCNIPFPYLLKEFSDYLCPFTFNEKQRQSQSALTDAAKRCVVQVLKPCTRSHRSALRTYRSGLLFSCFMQNRFNFSCPLSLRTALANSQYIKQNCAQNQPRGCTRMKACSSMLSGAGKQMASETARTISNDEEKDLPVEFQRGASKLLLGTFATGLGCPSGLETKCLQKAEVTVSHVPSASSGWRFLCSFK